MELKLNKNLIAKNQVIAVALSGGKDSVSLLHALINLKKSHPFTLKAINVDHGIRGIDSETDSNFCKKLAKKYDVELLSFAVDSLSFSKTNKLSLEEGARKLRYDCFFQAIESGFCQVVATAHHKSDLCETVLFNLFRGCGISGAKGMEESSFNGKIIHPMLSVSREEIDDYALIHQLSYVYDSTNADPAFTRNYIRLSLVPQIKAKFPAFEDAILRFSKTCKEDEEYFIDLAQKTLSSANGGIKISLSPIPVFKRACILALNQLGVKKDYTAAHVDSLIKLSNLQTGSQISLPKGIIAIKEQNVISFYKPCENNFAPVKFSFDTFKTLNYLFSVKPSSFDEFLKEKPTYKSINGEFVPRELFIDLDKIPADAEIRTINEGDIFTKFNGQKKSVKKFLTDKKLNKTQRKNLIVIAVDNQVLAVFGVEISPMLKIDKSTKNIGKLTCNLV